MLLPALVSLVFAPVDDSIWAAITAGSPLAVRPQQLDVAASSMLIGASCDSSSPCWPVAGSAALPIIAAASPDMSVLASRDSVKCVSRYA